MDAPQVTDTRSFKPIGRLLSDGQSAGDQDCDDVVRLLGSYNIDDAVKHLADHPTPKLTSGYGKFTYHDQVTHRYYPGIHIRLFVRTPHFNQSHL